MELRIGISRSPKEIVVELDDDADVKAIKEQVEAAVGGESTVLWMVDKKGREVGVASRLVSYIDFGTPNSGPGIGFGS